jgi:imidazolonepropionase
VFTLKETEKIINCGMSLGLRATVHADELASYGAAQLAAELGADSADHLIQIDSAGIAALAKSDTVAVVLPGTVFSLGIDKWAPAREMIDQGVAVALATDFNPGSSPIRSMQVIMSIACTQMKMTPAEALVASTINSASALGLSDKVGSIAPGKCADYIILDYDDYRLVPYHTGHNSVVAVFRNGEQVVG